MTEILTPRVLVTGGAGFIGSRIVARELARGSHVTVVDDLSTGSLNNVPDHENFRIQHLCVTMMDALEDCFDRVYHFASPASPDDFVEQWQRVVEANVIGLLHSKSLLRRGGELIYASSSEVYGRTGRIMSLGEPGVVDCLSARGVYDESKRLCEAMIYNWALSCSGDERFVVCRIFNTYGSGMPDDGRVVGRFVRAALAGEPLLVHGTGQQSRSFCYVDDTVDQILLLADRVAASDDHRMSVFNVGSDYEVPVIELARLVLSLVEGTASVIEHVDSPRPGDPVWRRPDMSATTEEIGCKYEFDLLGGLSRTVHEERERIAWS